MSSSILGSWKEIAAYLGKGVRTVQRWEHELGLPVRRPVGGGRHIVLASSLEIDRWLQSNLAPGAYTSNLASQNGRARQISQQGGPARGSGSIGGGGTNSRLVLVVDDNEVQSYAISRILERHGFTTSVVGTGEEAFRLALELRPQVILSDIVLPDITGLDLCKRLRRQPTLAGTGIVFYSALTGTDFESHGGDAFLTYPLPEETLTESLENAMRRHEPGGGWQSKQGQTAAGH